MTARSEGPVRRPSLVGASMGAKFGNLIRSGRLGVAVAMLAVLGAPATASAGTKFWGIVSTVRTSPKTMARLNVADPDPGFATFTVFPPNSGIPFSDTVQFVEGFASSASSTLPEIANLFTGAGGSTGLVMVESSSVLRCGVVLEQSSWDGKVELTLPPQELAAGERFVVPIGDLQQGTSLLVGNIHDSPIVVSVRYGGSLPDPAVQIDSFSIAVIDITRSNIGVILESSNLRPVIAQLAVDTGKTTVMTYLTPIQ